ncbi:MAG: AAA family ATPase, partial [Myxococcaceae bacterium]
NYQANVALGAAQSLTSKLVPGPRHPENRSPLVSAARLLAGAVELRLSRGMSAQGEGRSGLQLAASIGEVLELCRAAPELRDRLPGLGKLAAQFCRQALEQVALSAESSEFDATVAMDGLVALADNLEEEIARVGALAAQLSAYVPNGSDGLTQLEDTIRQRTAVALRRRVRTSYLNRKTKQGELLETLSTDSRRLAQLERSIARLSPTETGVREELLGPLGADYAAQAFTQAQFDRIDALARQVQNVMETLRREGISAERAVEQTKGVLEQRLSSYAASNKAPQVVQPGAPTVASGAAYEQYRGTIANKAKDGELVALLQMDAQLVGVPSGSATTFLSENIKKAVAVSELQSLQVRVRYLRSWLTQLLDGLPAPEDLKQRTQAEQVLDKLVKSRFPTVALREGELLRLQSALMPLMSQPGEIGENAKALHDVVEGMNQDFTAFSKRLLEVRSQL